MRYPSSKEGFGRGHESYQKDDRRASSGDDCLMVGVYSDEACVRVVSLNNSIAEE